MIFNLIRKFCNLFGIQLLKLTTYDKLVRNLSTESLANVELNNALINSIYKERFQSKKSAILLNKITLYKDDKSGLDPVEKKFLLDTRTLSSDILLELNKEPTVQFSNQIKPTAEKINFFKTQFKANVSALSSIDYLQSKYSSEMSDLSNGLYQFKIQAPLLKKLLLKKDIALTAITALDSKYSKTLQGLKYYE